MIKVKVILAGWLLVLSAGVIRAEPAAPGLEADPPMQERIQATVSAIVKEDPAVQDRFEDLRALAGTDRHSLLLQLALYLERSDSTEESMGGALILDRLEFTPDEKLDAVLPHLAEAEPGIRRVFTEILGTIDRPDGEEPDFSLYEDRLDKDRRPPARELIRYMYEVSPAAALGSMSRVYGEGNARQSAEAVRDLEAILARHEVSPTWGKGDRTQALEILDALSRDPAWWVRLYAAETLSRNRAITSPEITGRLENDPDPLVRMPFGS